jgi:hypothetical protein
MMHCVSAASRSRTLLATEPVAHTHSPRWRAYPVIGSPA